MNFYPPANNQFTVNEPNEILNMLPISELNKRVLLNPSSSQRFTQVPAIEPRPEQFFSLESINTYLNTENKGYIPVVEISELYTVMPQVHHASVVKESYGYSPYISGFMRPYLQSVQPRTATRLDCRQAVDSSSSSSKKNY